MGGGKKPTTSNKDKASNPGKKSKKDKESTKKGIVKRVGGYSGHHLYQAVSS